ncbi:hypothetical protein HYU11_02365 [Candidatus Woesearchaeota archaeon]|nr:hypothetical protein [Candidatus Woesearchaeota archaeon]
MTLIFSHQFIEDTTPKDYNDRINMDNIVALLVYYLVDFDRIGGNTLIKPLDEYHRDHSYQFEEPKQLR